MSHSQGQMSSIAAAVVKKASRSGINLPGVTTEEADVLQGALGHYAYLLYFLLEETKSLPFCVMLPKGHCPPLAGNRSNALWTFIAGSIEWII